MLFVNGYRLKKSINEYPDTDNTIWTTDRHAYWDAVDKQFAMRLRAAQVFYADGHHSITTSNHRTMIDFGDSALNV